MINRLNFKNKYIWRLKNDRLLQSRFRPKTVKQLRKPKERSHDGVGVSLAGTGEFLKYIQLIHYSGSVWGFVSVPGEFPCKVSVFSLIFFKSFLLLKWKNTVWKRFQLSINLTFVRRVQLSFRARRLLRYFLWAGTGSLLPPGAEGGKHSILITVWNRKVGAFTDEMVSNNIIYNI